MAICVVCDRGYAAGGLVKHVNQAHSGVLLAGQMLAMGIVRHAHCGKYVTPMGLTRHSHRCQHGDQGGLVEAGDGVVVAAVGVGGIGVGAGVGANFAANVENVMGVGLLMADAIPVVPNGDAGLGDLDIAAGVINGGDGPVGLHVAVVDDDGGGVLVGQPQFIAADAVQGLGVVVPHTVVFEDANLLARYVRLRHIAEPRMLHKAISQAFVNTVEVVSQRYHSDPSAVNLLRLLAIPKLCIRDKVSDTRIWLKRIVEEEFLHLFDLIEERPGQGGMREEPDPMGLSHKEVQKIVSFVGTGQARKAMALVRGASAIAPLTPGTLATLRAKHPNGAPAPFGNRLGNVPVGFSDDDWEGMQGLVQKQSRQTSGGLSGWNAMLVQVCFGAERPEKWFQKALRLMTSSILQGTAKGRSMLCASRLTPLQEGEHHKIRPIACGELFYRICTKFLLKVVDHILALLPTQLGVGSPGGVEPMVEILEMERDRVLGGEASRKVICLDMSNAFNSISRAVIAEATFRHAPQFYRLTKWAYGEPTPLILGDGTIIPSSEGVRQGCPLGPFLFSLGLRAKLEQMSDLVGGVSDIISSYLDDIMVVTHRPDMVARIVELFAPGDGVVVPLDGLVLNVLKTREIDTASLVVSDDGFGLLGSMVGGLVARRAFLNGKIQSTVRHLGRLRQLPAQVGLWLLRECVVPENMHLLRTMDWNGLEADYQFLDGKLLEAVEFFRKAIPDTEVTSVMKTIYHLPLSMGGCGIHSYLATRRAARNASRESSRAILRMMHVAIPNRPEPELGEEMEAAVPLLAKQSVRMRLVNKEKVTSLLASLSESDSIRFHENYTNCGGAWLQAQPRHQYHSLSDTEVATALSIKVLMENGANRAICSACGQEVLSGHVDCCMGEGAGAAAIRARVWRHNRIRDAVLRAVRSSKRIVRAEPLLINNNNRRADLWIGAADNGVDMDGRNGWVDFKVKHAFAPDTQHVRDLVPVRDDLPWQHLKLDNALGESARECDLSYAPLNLPQRVVPCVISAGGFLHHTFLAMLVDLLDAGTRKKLFVDISLALIKARAMVYVLY